MNALGLITLKSFGITLNKPKDVEVTEKTNFNKEEPEGSNNEIIVSKNSIIGYYNTDINLLELNIQILKIIDLINTANIEHNEQIKDSELYKIKLRQTKNERETSLRIINKSNEEIQQGKSNIMRTKYTAAVSEILSEYSKIGVLKQYITFGKGIVTHNIEETKEKRYSRLILIEKFLDIANNYVNINISKKNNHIGCPACGFPLPKIDSNDGDNPTCIRCETEIVQLSTFIPDNESIPTKKTGPVSEGRNNFIKDLSRYQGKLKNSKIPANLKQLLDDYFNMITFPTGDTIKSNSDLLKKTNKDLMYSALKNIGMSKLYKDINLVCHMYWGWELINLEEIEDEILKRYDQIYEVYDVIKLDHKDKRSSSLNSQYVLWWILDSMDFDCSPSDFKIPKTPEIFEYYEKTREQISGELGWNYSLLKIECII